MAQKRKVEVESKAPEAEAPPEDLSWKDWFLRRYARSWYWLACLFLDVFIFLEMQRVLHTNALVAAMAGVAVAVLQLAIYFRIWGRGGPLAADSDGDD